MNNNSDMAFIDHLEELRWRILKSLGSVLVMSILTFNFADYFVYMLTAPADNRGIGLPVSYTHLTLPTTTYV